VVWGILVMLEVIVIGTLIILAAGVLWVRSWHDDYSHPYD